MFKKLNSKKGEVFTIAGIYTLFASIGAATIIASILLTPSHRVRKAISFCEKEGMTTEVCKDKVKDMTKKDILSYIKDDGKEKSILDY